MWKTSKGCKGCSNKLSVEKTRIAAKRKSEPLETQQALSGAKVVLKLLLRRKLYWRLSVWYQVKAV